MTNAVMETEATIYAKVLNFEGLKQASRVESHLQIEGKFSKPGARCRVRRTIVEGKDPVYEYTVKVPSNSGSSLSKNLEKNIVVDEEFCDIFIKVSEKYLVKTRYSFVYKNMELKVQVDGVTHDVVFPEIIYEVDIFKKQDGEISQFCKIDVELDKAQKFLLEKFPQAKKTEIVIKISHLPINPSGQVLSKDKSPEAQKFMSDLWDNEFNRRYKNE